MYTHYSYPLWFLVGHRPQQTQEIHMEDYGELYKNALEQHESARDLLANGQIVKGMKVLYTLYDDLRKQSPTEEMWELRVRLLQMQVAIDLKSLTFGLSGFDGWDV